MFDYMFSSDIFVDDMSSQARLLVEHLRLHPPGPKAIVTDSPEAHATMMRLHKTFAEAPTRLEIVPGATHLFEEPGALEQVASLARDFFHDNLGARTTASRTAGSGR